MGHAAGGGTPWPTRAGRSTGSNADREVERLDVGALDAHRRELLVGVGERALDPLPSRSIVALGPGDADPYAGCRARVGARVVPPPPQEERSDDAGRGSVCLTAKFQNVAREAAFDANT